MRIFEKYYPWVLEIFFPGATTGFSKNFLGEPKVVKFTFSHWKLRTQTFLLKSSKSRVGQGFPFPLADTHDLTADGFIAYIPCQYTVTKRNSLDVFNGIFRFGVQQEINPMF